MKIHKQYKIKGSFKNLCDLNFDYLHLTKILNKSSICMFELVKANFSKVKKLK